MADDLLDIRLPANQVHGIRLHIDHRYSMVECILPQHKLNLHASCDE